MDTLQNNKLAVTIQASHFRRQAHDQLVVSRELTNRLKQSLKISFQRTVRVPDNGDTNNLPPSLGTFSLYKTAEYADIPPALKVKSEFFLPMYQREAMWINFECEEAFAVKIYLGGINAVSGEPGRETEKTLDRRAARMQKKETIQDYVVTPDQLWLDGFASEDGKVRQFVAMPLGQGYPAEAQISGEEAVGGLQIEVVPTKPSVPTMYGCVMPKPVGTVFFPISIRALTGRSLVFYVSKLHTIEDVKTLVQDTEGIPPNQQRLIHDGKQLEDSRTLDFYKIKADDVMHLILRLRGGGELPKEMLEMGICPGGLIKQTIKTDNYNPFSWDSENGVIFNVQILNSAAFKRYTGMNPPPTPITQAQYAAHGFPYYVIYDEKPSEISGDFAGVKSVNEMDVEGKQTIEKAKAVAEVIQGTNTPVVLLNYQGHSIGFRTRVDMEKEVRQRFAHLGI